MVRIIEIPSMMNLISENLFSFFIDGLRFLTGIIPSKSWIKPNGQAQLQNARPNIAAIMRNIARGINGKTRSIASFSNNSYAPPALVNGDEKGCKKGTIRLKVIPMRAAFSNMNDISWDVNLTSLILEGLFDAMPFHQGTPASISALKTLIRASIMDCCPRVRPTAIRARPMERVITAMTCGRIIVMVPSFERLKL